MERLKHFIKTNGLLYATLLPAVQGVRSARSSTTRFVRRQKSRLYRRRLEKFRSLCAAVGDQVEHPLFVNVGANDGRTGDPCSDILLANSKWRGLLIEPVPSCFARLQANFSDTSRFELEQVAVGATASMVPFYYVDESARGVHQWLPQWFDQLGSFDRGHISKHLNGALEPFIRELQVEVVPLSAILERHGVRSIELLHIDTEGFDDVVLETLDLDRYSPALILVEHKHLKASRKSAMRNRLSRHGYDVKDIGNDFVASLRRLTPVHAH